MKTSLYIHIPFCLSKCKYCDFFSLPCTKQNIPDSYINALCKEIVYRFDAFAVTELESIYLGGGTPSLLLPEQMSKIFDTIYKKIHFKSDCEVSVEMNPDDITAELLDFCTNSPITRISCGIQSLNQQALSFAGRRADLQTNLKALNLLSAKWKGELSLDLISALPFETEKSFAEGLEAVCALKPGHISLYALTIEEGTVFSKLIDEGKLEYDSDMADKMWLYGRDFLIQKGYEHYEVSNFCLNGRECRHNLRYWNHESYLGAGSGATGTVYNEKAQKKVSGESCALRWTNTSDIEEYTRFWNDIGLSGIGLSNVCDGKKLPQSEEKICRADSVFEFFMMGLRKKKGITLSQYKSLFGQELPEKVLSVMQEYQKRGLFEIIKIEDDINYRMNEKGLLFLNSFLRDIN